MRLLVALLSLLSLALVIDAEVIGKTSSFQDGKLLNLLRVRAEVLHDLIQRDCPDHFSKRSVHVPLGVSIEVEEGVVRRLQETLVKCRQQKTVDPSQLKMETVKIIENEMVYHMEKDLANKNSILFAASKSVERLTDVTSPNSTVETVLQGPDGDYNASYPVYHVRNFKFLNATTIILSDTDACCLKTVDRTTLQVSLFAGKCGTEGYANGNRFDAQFKHPFGIEIVKNDVFICDYNNKRLRRLDLINGTVISAHKFSSRPRDVVADAQQRYLYISANTHDSLQRIDLSNFEKVRLIMSDRGHQDGLFSAALLGNVRGLTFLTETTLAVVDSMSNRIRIIDLVSEKVSSICTGISERKDGTTETCSLRSPWGVKAIDDYLYIGTWQAIRRIPIAAITASL